MACSFFKIILFIFGCAGSSSLHGLSVVAVSRAYNSVVVFGLLTVVASLVVEHVGTWALDTGSVSVAHGLRWSMACGSFSDQGLNLCLLHCKLNSELLDTREAPGCSCY